MGSRPSVKCSGTAVLHFSARSRVGLCWRTNSASHEGRKKIGAPNPKPAFHICFPRLPDDYDHLHVKLGIEAVAGQKHPSPCPQTPKEQEESRPSLARAARAAKLIMVVDSQPNKRLKDGALFHMMPAPHF